MGSDREIYLHLTHLIFGVGVNRVFMPWFLCLSTVESVEWIRLDAMLVSYTQTNEDGEDEECPLILVTSREGDFTKVNFAAERSIKAFDLYS